MRSFSPLNSRSSPRLISIWSSPGSTPGNLRISSRSLTTTSRRMLRHRCPRIQCPGRGTYGSAATAATAVSRRLGDRKPFLMVTDPPYGISLDSEWRDRAGLNGCGPAEASYMKHRTEGHTETSISGDTRADWSGAFELVPSLQIAYVWHASIFTREVLDGLLRIGFL